jgi:ATP dependent DNA ligase-like protein
VFDLLYWRHESLCGRPLSFRRQVLTDLLARHQHPQLAFSAGIIGSGRELFTAAVAQGQEGIMAKHAARSTFRAKVSAKRAIHASQRVIPTSYNDHFSLRPTLPADTSSKNVAQAQIRLRRNVALALSSLRELVCATATFSVKDLRHSHRYVAPHSWRAPARGNVINFGFDSGFFGRQLAL